MHHRESIAPRIAVTILFVLTLACLLSSAARPDVLL